MVSTKILLRIAAMAGAAVGACSFSHGASGPPGDGGPDSSLPPDGGPCVAVSTECADSSTLRTCSAVGATYQDTACPWGCLGAGPGRCGQVVPGGGGVLPADVSGDNVQDTTIPDLMTVDVDSGAIGSSASPSSFRGSGLGVINGIDYEHRGNVAMFRFKSLMVPGSIVLVGAHPVAFVADTSITISGLVDVRGLCGGTTPGPGGFAGGAKQGGDATGSGNGMGGQANNEGGGGGGHGGSGGGGGNNSNMPSGGAPFGDDAISVLIGGGGGGGGSGGGNAGSGGGGGGALQLVANGPIAIAAGTGVGINAGGCGGWNGQAGNDAGGGGGAGGTVLIEAPSITVDGRIAVNGGGGGGGNTGIAGPAPAGLLGRMAAPGATQGTHGGSGAAGATATGSPGATTGGKGGGGGGGIGRIRLNTRTGSASIAGGAVLSPSLTNPSTTCTQGSATVQ